MSKVIFDKKKINELLTRGIEQVLIKAHLEKRLLKGERLRVKLGIDPSGKDLHLGHAVVLKKLKAFQDLGHEIILIVGSFTGMIGDPSGKTQTREPLSESQIKKNFATYKKQAEKIVDLSKTKVLYNHTWLKKLRFSDIIKLGGSFTVSQMIDRDMYQERIKKNLPISLPEFFYPLMQGYDSVHIKADVELGASDQLFNILAGRTIQKHYNIPEQDLIITPLLIGLDGIKKMGKSENNFVALNDSADEMYGKIMSIPDKLILHYFELATTIEQAEIKTVKQKLKNSNVNPRDIKMRLAREITTLYHSATAAKKAEEQFKKIFQKKEAPEKMPSLNINILHPNPTVSDTAGLGFEISKTEMRIVIKQKGLKKNNKIVISPEEGIKEGDILQKGKRHFIKIVKK